MDAKESLLFKNGALGTPLEDWKPAYRQYNELLELSEKDRTFLLLSRIDKTEKHLSRISKNIVFFFWVYIVGIVLGVIIFLTLDNSFSRYY